MVKNILLKISGQPDLTCVIDPFTQVDCLKNQVNSMSSGETPLALMYNNTVLPGGSAVDDCGVPNGGTIECCAMEEVKKDEVRMEEVVREEARTEKVMPVREVSVAA